MKAERAAAEALLAAEAGGTNDALFGGGEEAPLAPASAPKIAAPVPAPKAAAPGPAAEEAVPAPALAAAAPAPAAAPEGIPPVTAAAGNVGVSPYSICVVPRPAPTWHSCSLSLNPATKRSVTVFLVTGIVGNKEHGGKSFYEIRWTDASGGVHEVSRRYSEFDELRKKLIKMIGPQVKTLAFPVSL